MMRTVDIILIKGLCLVSFIQGIQSEIDLSSLWVGAEDFENNELPDLGADFESLLVGEGNILKSSRQDQEDVEVFLNPGPMLAPNIILNKFVDSRISLTNMDEIFQKSNTDNPDMDVMMNSIVDSEQMASDDSIASQVALSFGLNEMYQSNNTMSLTDKDNLLVDTTEMHRMSLVGAIGSFNLSLEKDSVIQITSPNEDSRLILTCSPIPLGDCSSHRDAVMVNVLGDVAFKQNSFLYCGQDANIRAISLKNKLAIKVKKVEDIGGSTFCLYHSRKNRELASNSGSVPCGRLGRSGKIIGGRRVPPGLFPWAAQLDITRTDGSQTGCTGSIVAPLYILTAAHCMKRAESVSAFVGGTDRLDIIGTEVLIQAEKYILHKKWSSRTLVADIALVKLTQPIQYTEDISPVCLPEGKLLSDDLSGRRGVAIGWGRTETKKKAPRRLYRVKLPMLSDTKCRKIYRRFYIPKVMICTDSQKDAAICYGMNRNSTQT